MRTLHRTVLTAALLAPRTDADEDLRGAIRAAEIATLLRQAQGQESYDRVNAARMLLENGEASLQPITEAVAHPDPWIRAQVTAALRGLGNPFPQLVDVLVRTAAERHPHRRDLLRALEGLTRGDPTLLGFWAGVAQDDDAVARAAAFRWLASLPPTGEGVKAVASGLDSSPVEVLRLVGSPLWWSFWAETRYADVAARARRIALDTLGRGEPERSEAAVRVLGHGRSGDAETMRALMGATVDPAPQVSDAAWLALADLVEDGAASPETLRAGFEHAPEQVLPRLVDAVYGQEARVADGLRSAFARARGPADLDLALALVRAGGPIDRPVIACIASYGPAGACDEALRSTPSALEVVRAAAWKADDTSELTRTSAIRALGAFPPGEVKVDLVKLLRCRDTFVLEATVQTLHRLGVGREETVAALLPMLHEASVIDKVTASRLLLDIGVRCAAQARALEGCLLEPENARYAAELIGRLGADAAPITPAILRALGSRDPEVILGVSTALAQIGPSDRVSYVAILNAAQKTIDLDWRPRVNAALRCAVWRALLAHPLLRAEDVARLLRETAVHAGDSCWYVDDIADVLARCGPREETLRVLVQMLAEPPHRLFAVRLLARIAPGSAEVATALLALIRGDGPEEIQEAVILAEKAGLHRDAVAVVRLPELFPPFGEPMRGDSCALLRPIDPRIATLCAHVLLRATGRVNALRALQAMTPPANEAIPQLRELARRSDPALRSQIERTVHALGG